MLAVAPLRDTTKDGRHGCVSESTSFSFNPDDDQFPDFGNGNLLESIHFDDLFAGINDGDVLPDLEMDPEILAEFSASGGEELETNASGKTDEDSNHHESRKEDQVSGSGKGDEIVNSKREGSRREHEKGRKSSSGKASKGNQGKRKVKVDWTPELHRRFVQAVDQLGVDKAVPSRILELMGIDCLTRHNIASHLQKYRSHRKHSLAREAEAASWTLRRQMYAGGGGGGVGKRPSEMSPWMGPTMGFPPAVTLPMHHPHLIRPLHVWGHPSVDQAFLHVWPKHLPHSPPPPPAWIPPVPPVPHPSFWPHHHRPRFGAAAAPAVGIPPQPQMGPQQPPFDPQPWKENIDAAIGDVLSKPWLPLPLGLKPPSIDSVMGELQRQGVPKVPPNPSRSTLNSTTFQNCLSTT